MCRLKLLRSLHINADVWYTDREYPNENQDNRKFVIHTWISEVVTSGDSISHERLFAAHPTRAPGGVTRIPSPVSVVLNWHAEPLAELLCPLSCTDCWWLPLTDKSRDYLRWPMAQVSRFAAIHSWGVISEALSAFVHLSYSFTIIASTRWTRDYVLQS